MGCDIHLYSETCVQGAWVADKANTFRETINDDNTTEVYTEMDKSYRGRNYWLFGLLASDVRTDWPWSFAQRGMPDDASKEVAGLFKEWDCDAHSSSWLTVKELREKLAELLIQPENEARDLSGYLTVLLEGLPVTTSDPDTQRIVFWFDN